VLTVAGTLVRWLNERGLAHLVETELSEALPGASGALGVPCAMSDLVVESDMVLSFGGDGTLLRTARLVGGAATPILGVNSGRLGFLAETDADELLTDIETLINGQYTVEPRIVLQACCSGHPPPLLFALNDMVIDKGAFSRTITLEVHIGSHYFNTYLADGVIIATPTGSTAYSLSSGGPILEPRLPGLVINPICPHSLGARPVVIDASATVVVRAFSELGYVRLFSDGQAGEEVRNGERIEIQRADFDVHLVQSVRRDFYELLRTKLNWGLGTTQTPGPRTRD